ncbi:CHAT domain-containing protein [Penicillium cataractarum]|uniref:CHAT domain-containing protein n=1 Tax=Penicillium cataractarum TaxID=2100454 RepID=A0A9W9SNM1_9EURO|nr:CHAT domain-containing protein [Penicillium cataractarum]KAJ5381029.1 CHAT domain-containing protein [Penicillium cataractarum]
MADLEEAQISLILALNHPTAVITHRVSAGRQLISFPQILRNPQEAYSISKTTIDLIPLLSSRSLQHSDKRHLLSAAVGLSCDAAAIALHAEKGPLIATEFLETGRGIIADALFERSEISILQLKHPELAGSLLELLEKLNLPPSRVFAHADNPAMPPDTEGSRRLEALAKLHEILKNIRSCQGFDRFFLPTSEADLLEATASGPIMIINDSIIEPILDRLGFTTPPLDNKWPYIWWIPTVLLAQFPLHVAGHHLRCTSETALDRVILSYSSSIKAINHPRQREHRGSVPRIPSNAAVVTMQRIPKQGTLKFASVEADAVLAICQTIGLTPLKPQPYKSPVLSALEHCHIFHFAGHGSTHPGEPLHSQLLLEDWETQPLTVESLLEINLSSNPPFLAYLSACGTGQVINKTSIDENIHLASAYQLAGFRHVIGTLWSVDDKISVDMARMTYEFLRDEGMTDDSVSRGLHHATRQLRDRWIEAELGAVTKGLQHLRLERDVQLDDVEVERRQAHWIPYVHYGI